MSMRCFIALDLDESIKNRLELLQGEMRRRMGADGNAVKWVQSEQIHITLKFLGDVDDGMIRDVCDWTSDVAQQAEPFDFEVGGCGCFPPNGAARVFWAGIANGQHEMAALAGQIDQAMNDLGFPLENRPFNAHLTLGRIKAPRAGHVLRETLEQIEQQPYGVQAVNNIIIYESTLERSGPIYTPIHHAALGGE